MKWKGRKKEGERIEGKEVQKRRTGFRLGK